MKKNDFGETIATNQYKTSYTMIDRAIMTETRMIEAGTITRIVMIEITPLATTGGKRINRETMMMGTGKGIRTIDAIIKNGMLKKRSIGNRRRITNGSWIEA